MSPSSFKKLVTTLMLFFLVGCSLLPVAISQGVSIEEEASGLNRSAMSESITENYGDTSIESLMNTTEMVSGSNSANFSSTDISSIYDPFLDLPEVNMGNQNTNATAYPSAAVDTKQAESEDTTKNVDQKTLQASFEPFGLPELLDLIRQNSKTGKQDDKTGITSKAQSFNPAKVNMKVDKSRMSFLLSKPNSNGTETIEKLNHEFKGLLSKIKYQIIESKWSTMSADDKTKFLNCVVCINNIYDVEDLLNIKLVSLIDENRDFVQFASYRKSEERMLANINNQARVEYMLRKAIWCESMPLVYTHLRLLNKLVIASLTEKYENILERKLNIQLEHLRSTMKRLRPSRTTDLSSGVSKVDKHIKNLEAE